MLYAGLKVLLAGALFCTGLYIGNLLSEGDATECIRAQNFDGTVLYSGAIDYVFLISEFSSLSLRIGNEEDEGRLSNWAEKRNLPPPAESMTLCW